MLFSGKTNVEQSSTAANVPQTRDTGKIRLGGACRLPVKTADPGKIKLGGACRLPLKNG